MVSRFGSTFNYLLRGLGIGSVVGILYAPKSGEDTRKYLAQKARDGSRYAHMKTQEVRSRAHDLVGRSKAMVAQETERIAMAIDAGRKVYHREKSKA